MVIINLIILTDVFRYLIWISDHALATTIVQKEQKGEGVFYKPKEDTMEEKDVIHKLIV